MAGSLVPAKFTATDSKVTFQFDKSQQRAINAAIRAIGPDARKYARARLKPVGEMVAAEIRRRTPVYGGRKYGKGKKALRFSETFNGKQRSAVHAPGLLKKSTKVRIAPSKMQVSVVNDAKARSAKYPGGYRYGKRLEFDPKFAGRYAWFYPGWAAKRSQAVAMFDNVLDDIAREFGG